MGLSGHQSARMKNDEWLTPPEIVSALGPFDLDPCSPINRPWPTAAQHFTARDDGLAQPWHGRVWCNPPFGREAVKWLRRMRDHGNGVALIPARTETAMFYETVWGHAAGVLFLRSRPHFHYVDGRRAPFNSGAPICLVAYGAKNLDALMGSGLGFTVVGSNVGVRRVVAEAEFAGVLRLKLLGVNARAVVGPGRSGAVASVYASHILGIPFLPYGVPCPAHLRPLLIVDTARKSGATLRKAEREYGDGECVTVWCFDEPPRVRFWYERDASA